jgi:hypothetical protein
LAQYVKSDSMSTSNIFHSAKCNLLQWPERTKARRGAKAHRGEWGEIPETQDAWAPNMSRFRPGGDAHGGVASTQGTTEGACNVKSAR